MLGSERDPALPAHSNTRARSAEAPVVGGLGARVVSEAHLGESGSEVKMPRHNGNTPPKVKRKPPKRPPTSKR
jgi:hypothetical protein